MALCADMWSNEEKNDVVSIVIFWAFLLLRLYGFSAFAGLQIRSVILLKTFSEGYYIDKKTGEMTPIPVGSKIQTKEEQEHIKKMMQLKREKVDFEKFKNEKCGGFFWSLYNVGKDYHPELSDDMLAKVIYLLTYLDYNQNILVVRDNANLPYRPMTKNDVRNVIRLHRCNFAKFWERLMDSGIISEGADGKLIVSEVFRRGKLTKKAKGGMAAIKIFSQAVRYMYEHIDVRSHKYLAYIYRLIPYINLRYNVFCTNPLEKDKFKIEPLTAIELCKIIGIEGRRDNENRLIDTLFKLMFYDRNGDKLSVITVIKRFENDEVCQYITINPQFYAGYISQEDMLDILEEFVKKEKELMVKYDADL